MSEPINLATIVEEPGDATTRRFFLAAAGAAGVA